VDGIGGRGDGVASLLQGGASDEKKIGVILYQQNRNGRDRHHHTSSGTFQALLPGRVTLSLYHRG
jgi:hypothetical protein